MARRDPAALGRILGAQGLFWPLLTPAFVVGVILRRLCWGEVDPDYFWHIATGRWMLDHGRIPTIDPFSYTHAGQSWYAHEWLAELVLATTDRVGGYALAVLLTTLVLSAGFWLLWRSAIYYGASRRTAALGVIAAVLLSVQMIAVRPQVWAFALIMALLHELAAHDTGNRRRLWHLPLLFILLININLLAVMAGMAFALYTVHRALVWWRAPGSSDIGGIGDIGNNVSAARWGRGARTVERSRFGHVFGVGVLSALALVINPRGPALLAFAARAYADVGSPYWRAIDEWKPLPFGGINTALYLIGAAATLAALAGMVRRRAIWPGLLTVVFAVMAARAARYMPLFGISVAISYAWYATSTRRGRADAPAPAPHLGALAIGAGLSVAAVIVWMGTAAQFRRAPDASIGAYPVAATAWLQANAPRAHVLNDYGWGGYLDEVLYPRSNVFIDGRAEMFGTALFRTYLDVFSAAPGWQQTLARWDVQAVLMKPDSGLAKALSTDTGWRQAFADSGSVIYIPAR
ncbi:MAG: hypothetical protein ACYDCQ_18790 [Dehalococcoidia bacterium]